MIRSSELLKMASLVEVGAKTVSKVAGFIKITSGTIEDIMPEGLGKPICKAIEVVAVGIESIANGEDTSEAIAKAMSGANQKLEEITERLTNLEDISAKSLNLLRKNYYEKG